MARITVEDCLQKEINRFGLVVLASKRSKQLLQGAKTLVDDPRGNKPIVTALREIAAGQVRFMTPEEVKKAEEESSSGLKSQDSKEGGSGGTTESKPGAKPFFDDAGESDENKSDSKELNGLNESNPQ